MYIMLTDETNRDPDGDSQFFVYGGLIVPMNQVESLSNEITEIRLETGYLPGDALKFDTNARPDQIDIQSCTRAKNQVVEACCRHGCTFIAYLILHQIARGQDERNVILWAADHVIGRFNRFLEEKDTVGIVAIDSLPVDRQFRYLSDKFTIGLELGEDNVELNRIHLYAATVLNASHLNSAMDIVLGCFRYAINNPQNRPAARTMMRNVGRLMWYRERDGDQYVDERGIIFRPKQHNIISRNYRQQYEELREYLNELVADVE